MRILSLNHQQDLARLMRDIKVDPYGIKIMAPKAVTRLVKINRLRCIAANILKQEMLALGGDAAIARDALTGKIKNTDCLLIGNLSQFNALDAKLSRQPFGLNKFAQDLAFLLNNYQKENKLDLGKYKLDFSRRSYIMGIINLTPDSFSGDGLYSVFPACRTGKGSRFSVFVDKVVQYARQMVKDGADIIDLGGESSQPGAKSVSLKEELRRTIPVIKILAKKIKVPLSIDTYKTEVARIALDNGASIVNDITALRSAGMAKVISRYNAAVVIMHMKGNPRTMQKRPVYQSLIDDITEYLNKAIGLALEAGIKRDKIIIDPGLGFGKTLAHNLEIIKRLPEFKCLGQPILVGPSRKSFIGKILNTPAEDRLSGTVSICGLAVRAGANIVRVHDVKPVKQALEVVDAVYK